MQSLLRQPTVRTALIAAWIGLAGAHAPAFATTDLPIAVEVCPKQLGRDPPSAMLKQSCGVSSADDFASIPSWNTLELMAIDGNLRGGGVVATLHCMSRSTGAVSAVATVTSGPSTTAKKAVVALPAPLDFKQCAYFVRVAADSTNAAAQALMVSLVSRLSLHN